MERERRERAFDRLNSLLTQLYHNLSILLILIKHLTRDLSLLFSSNTQVS